MEEKSPQIYDEDIPPIPSLRILKVKSGNDRNQSADNESPVLQNKPEPKPTNSREEGKAVDKQPQARAKVKPVARIEQPIYDTLANVLREDLQRELKRLKNSREETRHPQKTIKQFVEAAIEQEIASDSISKLTSEADSSLEALPNPPTYCPFRTEVRRDLLRQIRKWKFEQEDRGHPISSIKSFLNISVAKWLDSQK